MTGYTVHTGASKKFVQGWDNIFGDAPKKGKSNKAASKKTAGKSSAKAKTGVKAKNSEPRKKK